MVIRTAEILCVGTELLLGDIINTNAAFLSKELAELGISQYRQSVVGDNRQRLEDTIKTALDHCDLLILTGGLGPTYDDITRETAAKVIKKELVLDNDCLADIESFFKKRGKTMTANNIKQAMIIKGSTVLKNTVGTAPGTLCCANDKILVLLPGPPSEMKEMWKNQAKPIISQYCEKVIVSKNINIVGIGESAVEDYLKEMMLSSCNPTVAPYCKTAEVRLRVTASAATKEEAISLCDKKIKEIEATEIGKYIYGIDTSLEEAVVKRLNKYSLTIATAESCTGGLIAKTITDVPGSSAVFEGSVVSYSNRIKNAVLGVSEHRLEAYGAVSHQVAIKMAEGVHNLMDADVAVAVTGIAGPGGGTEKKPVGLVYISVYYNGETTVKKYKFGSHNSRERIRELTLANALNDVLSRLKQKPKRLHFI